MNTLLIVSLLLNGTTIIFFISVMVKIIFLSKDCIELDSDNEEYFCKDCGCVFEQKYSKDFKYCPYCSTKLTLYLNKDHEALYKDKE